MGRFVDITGNKYRRLTVERYIGKGKWLCRCDCGKETIARTYELKKGTRVSCGCAWQKHGMTNTRLHVIWNSMRCRCERKETHGYNRYGGRGISVCDEWKQFIPFMEWALANGYSEDLTLDRIDNNKGYSPDNCRWATREEQCNNQRTNRKITCNGKTRTIAQWARLSGLDRNSIVKRLDRGMTPEQAIFLPNPLKAKPIIAVNPDGGRILWFESGKDAERHGHTRSAIWRVLTGEYKTHHGMIWEYAEDVVKRHGISLE